MSFVILKRTEIVPEGELQNVEGFVRAEEKGYPSLLHPLKIVAEFDLIQHFYTDCLHLILQLPVSSYP